MKNAASLRQHDEVCPIPCFDRRKVAAIRANLAREEARLPALADFYKLLGNTTRLKILFALAAGELCVCDVAHVLGLSIAATSHQLKLLRNQGWLRKREDRKMVYYRVHSAQVLKALRGDLRMVTSMSG